MLLAPPAAGASKPGKVTRVQASCAGDLIKGKASVSSPAMVWLQLLRRKSARGKFVATKKLAWIRARQSGSYGFKFDISKLEAKAYRIRAKSGAQSRVLKAAACAPGLQVPEAPFAILLPLSLLLALGLPLALRRLRRSTAVSS
jgi:hypothetical protein